MRINYPRAGRRAPWRYFPTFKQLFSLGVIFLVLIVAACAVAYALIKVPDPKAFSVSQATVLYNSDGKTRLGTIGALDRVSVPLSQVPVPVQHAVLAAEDRNFYSEPGVSPTGIMRALWADVRGRDLQGGSTITQQYVKNAYLSQARTLSRKVKEVFIAVKLARERSKDEILQDYLNTIYFGRGAYGIEAASQAFFGKDVSQLSLAEGAVLAAGIRSPANYDPARHLDASKARWNYVMDGMVKKGWLTPQQRAAERYPTDFRRSTPSSLAGPNGYLVAAVQAELEQHGFTEDQILRGGLRVVTTFDPSMQKAATAAVSDLVGDGKVPPDVRTALISVEPGTGAVRAMYGGADYQVRQFNDATMSIPPMGSTFKPYVLAAALTHGKTLASTYDGASPQTIAGRVFHNDSDEQFGNINLVAATAHSVNTVFVRLGIDVGVQNVIKAAHNAGLPESAKLTPNASMLLGSDSAHPIDQAAAYATFAADGVYAAPYFVQQVSTATGKVLYTAKPKTRQAFSPQVSAEVTYALEKVITEGTGTAATIDRPAAGKTGTTSGNVSAWFVGYTPQLSTAVAMFRDKNAPLQGIAGYQQIYGGTLPAKMWAAFMAGSLQSQPVENFPPVTVPTPTPSPTPTPTPTPSPSQMPTPSSTPPPSPSPTHHTGPPHHSQSPSPSESPTHKPKHTKSPKPSPKSSTGTSAPKVTPSG